MVTEKLSAEKRHLTETVRQLLTGPGTALPGTETGGEGEEGEGIWGIIKLCKPK